MEKQNCWEIMQCGRELGGKNVEELGLCRVPQNGIGDGFNGGTNRGRICWTISGTLCGGEIQGTYAKKLKTCLSCKMYKKVKEEEGENFIMLLPGQTLSENGNGEGGGE